MGRPRGTSDNRDRIVNFRLTTPEHEKLQHEAEVAGLSMSNYCRAKVLGESSENLRAYHALANNIAGFEEALATAKRALGGEEH